MNTSTAMSKTPEHSRRRHVRTGRVSPAEAAERRALILRVAQEEFLAHGFAGTNLMVIARRSRVSKTTLYNEFGPKENLFLEVVTRSVSSFRYDLEALMQSASRYGMGQPFSDVLRAVITMTVDMVSNPEIKAILRMVVTEQSQFPEIGAILKERTDELLQPLIGFFRTHLPHQAVDEAEARRIAYHLTSMAMGGFGFFIYDTHSLFGDRDVWVESVLKTFLGGAAPKSAKR